MWLFRCVLLVGLVLLSVGLSRCACSDPNLCQNDAQCTAPARCLEDRCRIPDASDPNEPNTDMDKEGVVLEGSVEGSEFVGEMPVSSEVSKESISSDASEPIAESVGESLSEPVVEKAQESVIPETPSEPMPEPLPPVCMNGAQRPCYTGPIQTQQIGACRDGVQRCEGGQWGACANERQPQPEKCDGQDNDCDGTTDEDIPQDGQNCVTGLPGVCASGKLKCDSIKGMLECLPFNKGPEICDGLDNNCDGKVDEGCP